jgi:hypothetical protein
MGQKHPFSAVQCLVVISAAPWKQTFRDATGAAWSPMSLLCVPSAARTAHRPFNKLINPDAAAAQPLLTRKRKDAAPARDPVSGVSKARAETNL